MGFEKPQDIQQKLGMRTQLADQDCLGDCLRQVICYSVQASVAYQVLYRQES